MTNVSKSTFVNKHEKLVSLRSPTYKKLNSYIYVQCLCPLHCIRVKDATSIFSARTCLSQQIAVLNAGTYLRPKNMCLFADVKLVHCS